MKFSAFVESSWERFRFEKMLESGGKTLTTNQTNSLDPGSTPGEDEKFSLTKQFSFTSVLYLLVTLSLDLSFYSLSLQQLV